MVLEAYCAKQGWSFELIKDLGECKPRWNELLLACQIWKGN